MLRNIIFQHAQSHVYLHILLNCGPVALVNNKHVDASIIIDNVHEMRVFNNKLFGFAGEPSCWRLIHRFARRSELDIITRSVVRRSIGKQ